MTDEYFEDTAARVRAWVESEDYGTWPGAPTERADWCPVLYGLLDTWRMRMEFPEERQRLLVPLLERARPEKPRGSFGQTFRRAYLVVDRVVRSWCPAALRFWDAADDEARRLEALAPVTDVATALAAGRVVALAARYATEHGAREPLEDAADACLAAGRYKVTSNDNRFGRAAPLIAAEVGMWNFCSVWNDDFRPLATLFDDVLAL